jgi:putative heme iron utilization protein
MNYIKRLQRDTEEAKRRLAKLETEIQEFRAYVLQSPKFTGVDIDGGRKDWISTSDLDQYLQRFHSISINGC